MVDGLIYGVGCVAFFLFFVADFFMAYTLNVLKQQHPAIDDSAPSSGLPAAEHNADLARAARLSSQARGGVDNSASHAVELDDDTISIGANRSATLAAAATLAHAVSGAMPGSNNNNAFGRGAQSVDHVHRFVIVCSLAAPFIWLFQLFAPVTLAWTFFPVPEFLGYLLVVPGFCLAMFYVLRVSRLSQQHECTKSQWLAAMWFRLDVICVMAGILLFGWGDWLVAACLFVVDVYLAQRLLATERTLLQAMRGTQLLPEEDVVVGFGKAPAYRPVSGAASSSASGAATSHSRMDADTLRTRVSIDDD